MNHNQPGVERRASENYSSEKGHFVTLLFLWSFLVVCATATSAQVKLAVDGDIDVQTIHSETIFVESLAATLLNGTSFVGGTISAFGNIQTEGSLFVLGQVRSTGVFQDGNAPPATYSITQDRYVVEARAPQDVGSVVPVDEAIMNDLCRDKDGCDITLVMMNWLGEGRIASKNYHFFLSETSQWWRFSNIDTTFQDDDDSVDSYNAWDCFFTDGETSVDSANGRLDETPGFGLLNANGGTYSDLDTHCRLVIED